MSNTSRLSRWFLVLVGLLLLTSLGVTGASNFRLRPDSTSSAGTYFYTVGNLSLYYDVQDSFGVLQDLAGVMYWDGVENVTLPQSMARWTFDYDYYSNVTDRSITQNGIPTNPTNGVYHGSQPAMFVNGIVHYLGFERCSATACEDWSRNKVNASIPALGSTLQRNYTDCLKGSCLTFDGTQEDSVNVTNTTGVNSNLHNLTISAWIKIGKSSALPKIVVKSSPTTQYMEFYLRQANSSCGADSARLAIYRNMAGSSISKRTVCVPIRDGEWHHVATTFKHDSDSNVENIYVDGAEPDYNYTQSSSGAPTDDHLASYLIGMDFDHEDQLNGSIDEVYIYNTSLSAQEILLLSKDTGRSGYAYLFRNVTERVSVPNAAAIKIQNCSAVGAWFYPFTTRGTQKIVQKGFAGAGSYALRIVSSSPTCAQALYTIVDSAGNTYSASWSNKIEANTWYHLLGVTECDGSGRIVNVTLYVDGERAPTVAVPTGSGYFTSTCALTFSEIGGHKFTGLIDEVTLYNQSLTAGQAGMIYEGLLSTDNLAFSAYSAAINYTNSSGLFSVTPDPANVSGGSLNFTVFDEGGASLSGTNVSFTLTLGDIVLQNYTTTGQITIYDLSEGVWSTDVVATDYQQRTYEIGISSADLLDYPVFLLANGSQVVFSVTDQVSGAFITGALGKMYRYVSGAWSLVDERTSDVSGNMVFSYSPSGEYRFTLSKDGYEDLSFTFSPIVFSEYDVKMSPTSSVDDVMDFDRVLVTLGDTFFYDGVLDNFSVTFYSVYGELLDYGFNLSFPGGWVSDSGSFLSGERLEGNFTISGATVYDMVRLEFYYDTSLSGRREFVNHYGIILGESNMSMIGLRDRDYGLGLFERVLLTVAIGIFIVGVASLVGKPVPGMVLSLLVFGYLVYIGFISFWAVGVTFVLGVMIVVWRGDF